MDEVKKKFEEYLTSQHSLKPRAVCDYLSAIRRVEDFCGRDLTTFKRYSEASEAFIRLKKEGNIVRPGEVLSDRTIFKLASMVKSYWDFCALYEYMPFQHPFYLGHGFKKGEFKEPEYFDRQAEQDILRQILWHLEIPLKSRVILWLFYSTGVRRKELVSLNISDVDLVNRFIHVKAEHSKTGKYRDVPFDKDCQLWLNIWIRSLNEYFGKESQNSDFPLIPMDDGSRMSVFRVWKNLEKIGCLFNQKINPHKWRHSLASFLVKHMDVTEVAKILGHANIQTTYQYTHFKAPTLRNAYDQAVSQSA